MITISRAQYRQLGQDAFDARLVAILKRRYPVQFRQVPFATLVQSVHEQAGRARGYGLADERAVATYVHAAWALGGEFDRRIPALSQVLRERRMTGERKAAALDDFVQLVFHTLAGAAQAAPARSVA